MSRPKIPDFIKNSVKRQPLLQFFNVSKSRYTNSQSLSGRSFIALTHFHSVYYNDFICVLRNVQIIILSSFYV